MAEYIEREAAKKEFDLNFGGVSHAVIANRILDALPVADVVEVVRCKDCKHANTKSPHGIMCYCPNGGQITTLLGDDDFCSCGERRETPCNT